MQAMTRFAHIDPQKTAITLGDLHFSYGRLAADIASMACWLDRQGVAAGQRVGIAISNPYWSWVGRFAALRMGLTQVTLGSRDVAGKAAATGLLDIALGELAGVDCTAIARQAIVCAPQSMAPFAKQYANAEPDPDGMAPLAEEGAKCLMLTSGTTARQRVVVLSYDMLMARLAIIQSSQALTGDTCLLPTTGSNTMPGFGYSLATWRAGGCVQFVTGKESVPRLETHLLVTTPAELQILLNMASDPWANREKRRIIVVGGRLPVAVRDDALARACSQVLIDYGATETNCTATGDASLLDRHPGAIGFAVADACIEVVDAEGQLQPPGSEGLIRTRTPYMVLGYGADQEHQAEVFRAGWFYPGDLGVMFADGLVAITGRQAETLNVSGTKIPLLDFEAPLERMPGLRDACAIVLKLKEGDQLAFLVVCGDDVDLQAVSQRIPALLPFPVQFKLLRVANIPRNAMGKIPRNALSEVYSEFYAREMARIAGAGRGNNR